MIHPTALVDASAQIEPSATIGPYALIKGPVQIAADVEIGAHALIEGPVKIAPKVVIGAHVHILGDTTIGEGTKIGRAAIIGEDPQDLSFDPATESRTVIGENNVIREQATIHRGSKPGSVTRLGDNNFIMANAHFAHDVQIGDRNVVANAALLAGHVHVGNGTFIGGGAVFHQFVRVGDFCVIQGNGGIGKDIPHYCAAQRVNRMTGLNVIGLRRQGFNSADRALIKELFDLIFRSGRNLSQAMAVARQREWPAHCERFLQFIEAPSKRGLCSVRAGVKAESDD